MATTAASPAPFIPSAISLVPPLPVPVRSESEARHQIEVAASDTAVGDLAVVGAGVLDCVAHAAEVDQLRPSIGQCRDSCVVAPGPVGVARLAGDSGLLTSPNIVAPIPITAVVEHPWPTEHTAEVAPGVDLGDLVAEVTVVGEPRRDVVSLVADA